MAGPSTKLGEAYIDVKVTTTNVDAGIDSAKVKVEEASKEIGQTAEREIGGGFQRIGLHIEEQTKGIRKFSGAISSTAGVVTSMIGVFGLVTTAITAIVALCDDWFGSAYRINKELDEQLKKYEDIKRSIEDQIASLRGVNSIEIDHKNNLLAIDKQRIEGVISYSQSFDLLAKEQERYELERKKAAEEAQRVWDENHAKMLEDIERQKQAQLDADSEVIRKRIDQIAEEGRKRMEMRKRENEEAMRESEALARAVTAEFSKAFSAATFQQSIAGPIEEMTRRLEARLDALKFGRGI